MRPYDRPEVCQTYFFPRPSPPLPRSATAEPVALPADDGGTIAGYWCHPQPSAPLLIAFHGNGEIVADWLDLWPGWARRAGANLLLVEYPGYGSCAARATFSGCCRAARAAMCWAEQQPSDAVPSIVLLGRSVGSIFALHALDRGPRERLAGIVLESGIADVAERLSWRVPFAAAGIDRRELEEAVARDFDHRRILAEASVPVLVLHCRHDTLVGSDNAERMAQWAGPKLHRLVLFDRGDHNSIHHANAAAYVTELSSFVDALRAP